MSRSSIPIHTVTPFNQGSGTVAQQWLTSNAGSLKVWGLRPHAPPLTMSAVLLENKREVWSVGLFLFQLSFPILTIRPSLSQHPTVKESFAPGKKSNSPNNLRDAAMHPHEGIFEYSHLPRGKSQLSEWFSLHPVKEKSYTRQNWFMWNS
jgi:hypothetical protein